MLKIHFFSGWGLQDSVWDALRAELPPHHAHIWPARPGSHSLSAWAADCAAHIAEEDQDHLIIAWSLGSLLAQYLALHHPTPRLRGVVLCAGTPSFQQRADWPHGLSAAVVNDFQQRFTQQPAATLKRFIVLQTLGDTHRSTLGRQLEQHCLPPQDAKGDLENGLYILQNSDLRSAWQRALPALPPALLLHGEHDALMPIAAAQHLQQAWPHSQLIGLPGCGHAPHLSQSATCAAHIQRFIATNA